MTEKSTLISQDYRVIILDIDGKRVQIPADGFDIWLYQNHPDTFNNYIGEGTSTNFFDIIMFNQSKEAKRYYLQYLNQMITKDIDQWDKVEG